MALVLGTGWMEQHLHTSSSFQYLKEAYRQEGDGLFKQADNDMTRGNAFKVKEGKFKLGIRRKIFT